MYPTEKEALHRLQMETTSVDLHVRHETTGEENKPKPLMI